MDETPRPTIVYVGGHDRSGSTLLDRLLGELPGCVSVGEARRLWDRGLGEDQLCGCGTPLRSCERWSAILDRAFGPLSEERIAAMRSLVEQASRTRMFPRLLFARSGTDRDHALGGCREVLANLYRAIADESGCSIVIDSSKDPVYAALLLSIPELDVRLIHLVRDARAVAFSQRRLKSKPEIHWTTRLRRRRSVLETAIRWDASALMWRMLAKRGGAMLLRYEDLALRPAETLEALAGSLRREPAHRLEVFRDGVRLGVAHSVSGASVRFHQGDLEVTLDDEWNRAMLPRERRMVTALTWPGLLRFGYPLRTSEASSSTGGRRG